MIKQFNQFNLILNEITDYINHRLTFRYDKQYYYDRPRRKVDYHGQAPYLWCVNALLEK